MLQSLPNLLSLTRLLIAPVVVWLILADRTPAAFWLAVAAATTDLFDGLLARGLGAHSSIGKLLDPLADKVLMAGILGALAAQGALPDWFFVTVLARDAAVAGMALLAGPWWLNLGGAFGPSLLGKAATLVQTLVATLGLAATAFALGAAAALPLTLLVWAAAAVTVVSGADYALRLGLGQRRQVGPERAR